MIRSEEPIRGVDMTSGQGGSDQEPTGQPDQQGQYGGQGSNPVPPQQPPSYPAAPPSYPAAPPSYPAAPGDGPVAWGAQAPRPVERPVQVRAGLGAFVAHIVLGIVESIFLFTDQRDLLDAAIRQAGGDTSEEVLRTALILGGIIALVFVGLELMFMWFAWIGRNWARIVLWVLFGLNVVSGLTALGGSPYGGFYTSLSVIQLLLAIAGIVLLALPQANEWYRYRRWLRDTGQAR
jgi:hypothetical protein